MRKKMEKERSARKAEKPKKETLIREKTPHSKLAMKKMSTHNKGAKDSIERVGGHSLHDHDEDTPSSIPTAARKTGDEDICKELFPDGDAASTRGQRKARVLAEDMEIASEHDRVKSGKDGPGSNNSGSESPNLDEEIDDFKTAQLGGKTYKYTLGDARASDESSSIVDMPSDYESDDYSENTKERIAYYSKMLMVEEDEELVKVYEMELAALMENKKIEPEDIDMEDVLERGNSSGSRNPRRGKNTGATPMRKNVKKDTPAKKPGKGKTPSKSTVMKKTH